MPVASFQKSAIDIAHSPLPLITPSLFFRSLNLDAGEELALKYGAVPVLPTSRQGTTADLQLRFFFTSRQP